MLGCRHWLPSHSGALKFRKLLAWIWNICDFRCSAGAWFVTLGSETFISLIVTPIYKPWKSVNSGTQTVNVRPATEQLIDLNPERAQKDLQFLKSKLFNFCFERSRFRLLSQ